MRDFRHPSLTKISIAIIVAFGIASTSKVLNPGYGFFDGAWPAIIAICVASAYLIELQAILHAYKIEVNNESPNHTMAWMLRLGVATVLSASFHAYFFSIPNILALICFGMSWGGALFTLRLNYYRMLPWDYISKDDKGSIWDHYFNSIFGKYGGKAALLVLLLFMILFESIYKYL